MMLSAGQCAWSAGSAVFERCDGRGYENGLVGQSTFGCT